MNFFKKNKGLFSMVAGTAALVASKVGEKLTETKKPIEKKQINIEYYVNALSEYQQQSEVLPTKEEIAFFIQEDNSSERKRKMNMIILN